MGILRFAVLAIVWSVCAAAGVSGARYVHSFRLMYHEYRCLFGGRTENDYATNLFPATICVVPEERNSRSPRKDGQLSFVLEIVIPHLLKAVSLRGELTLFISKLMPN